VHVLHILSDAVSLGPPGLIAVAIGFARSTASKSVIRFDSVRCKLTRLLSSQSVELWYVQGTRQLGKVIVPFECAKAIDEIRW